MWCEALRPDGTVCGKPLRHTIDGELICEDCWARSQRNLAEGRHEDVVDQILAGLPNTVEGYAAFQAIDLLCSSWVATGCEGGLLSLSSQVQDVIEHLETVQKNLAEGRR